MNALIQYAIVLLVSILIVAVIGAAIIIYFVKFKKVLAKEEKIDHKNFVRVDAKEYAKFDNIVKVSKGYGNGEFGILVMPNNVFIAGLDIKGFNFASASAEEQNRAMINAIAFMNTIEKPVQFRQTAKAIDIGYNVKKHMELTKKLELRLDGVKEDYKDTLVLLESYEDEPEIYETVKKQLDAMQRDIHSLTWQFKEAVEGYNYLLSLEKTTGKTNRINQMMFSYVFDPAEYSTELSNEEIYIKAFEELSTKASIYSSALENCGCKTRALTDKEIHDLIRRHNHPLTADDYPIEALYNSSYNALFVHSDDVLDLYRSEKKEKKFNAEMEEYRKQRLEAIREAKKRREKYVNSLSEAAKIQVDKEDAEMEAGGYV